jgi:hypothetical protein
VEKTNSDASWVYIFKNNNVQMTYSDSAISGEWSGTFSFDDTTITFSPITSSPPQMPLPGNFTQSYKLQELE